MRSPAGSCGVRRPGRPRKAGCRERKGAGAFPLQAGNAPAPAVYSAALESACANWSVSVEPVIAVVETAPPEMAMLTASK